MQLKELALIVLDAADESEINFMLVGAIPAGAHGVPRATRDVDLLVELTTSDDLTRLIDLLSPEVEFGAQTQFDTLTWGKRHVGVTKSPPPMKVELFETFNDPFVKSEFARRQEVYVPMLERSTWLPTAEDVIVQKLRWARPKDLEDARDVLAVQGPESLDMEYIKKWCAEHETTERLVAALDGIPPL